MCFVYEDDLGFLVNEIFVKGFLFGYYGDIFVKGNKSNFNRLY